MVVYFFWMKECLFYDMKLFQMQLVLKDMGFYLKYIGFMVVGLSFGNY